MPPMNTVTIETADSKIYSFSTMDSDKTELNGLLLGKKIEVQFSETIKTECLLRN